MYSFRTANLLQPQKHEIYSPIKLATIAMCAIAVTQFSVALDYGVPGFETMYGDVVWISYTVGMVVAFFLALFHYGISYYIETYAAFWGFRLMEHLQFTVDGTRFLKAMAVGAVIGFMFSLITMVIIEIVKEKIDVERLVERAVERLRFRKN